MHIEKKKQNENAYKITWYSHSLSRAMYDEFNTISGNEHIGVEVLKCRNINEIPKLQFKHSIERERWLVCVCTRHVRVQIVCDINYANLDSRLDRTCVLCLYIVHIWIQYRDLRLRYTYIQINDHNSNYYMQR